MWNRSPNLTAAGCLLALLQGVSANMHEGGADLGYQTLEISDAIAKWEDGFFDVFLDVRTEGEWDMGHVDGASHIILGEEDWSALAGCEDVKIGIYCNSGNRSKVAAEQLAEIGFKHVYELWGVMQWTAAGVELVHTPVEPITCPAAGKDPSHYVMSNHRARIPIDWRVQDPYEEMQNIQAHPGDILSFQWNSYSVGHHNVLMLKNCSAKKHKWNKFKCPKRYTATTGTMLGSMSFDYRIPKDATGVLCFVCTISGHCEGGQHSTVRITPKPEPEKPQPEPVAAIPVTWKTGMTMQEQSVEARPGQEIYFDYMGGHNLVLAKECDGSSYQSSSFDCNAPRDLIHGSGPYTWTVPADAAQGTYYCFYCSIYYHCSMGQRLTVMVKGEPVPAPIDDDDEEEEDEIDVLAICKAQKINTRCKQCTGKLKNGNCKISSKKFRKMNCGKVKKDPEFCRQIGCKPKGKKKCQGTLGGE